jgi:hypothetical protein
MSQRRYLVAFEPDVPDEEIARAVCEKHAQAMQAIRAEHSARKIDRTVRALLRRLARKES